MLHPQMPLRLEWQTCTCAHVVTDALNAAMCPCRGAHAPASPAALPCWELQRAEASTGCVQGAQAAGALVQAGRVHAAGPAELGRPAQLAGAAAPPPARAAQAGPCGPVGCLAAIRRPALPACWLCPGPAVLQRPLPGPAHERCAPLPGPARRLGSGVGPMRHQSGSACCSEAGCIGGAPGGLSPSRLSGAGAREPVCHLLDAA